MSRASAAVLAFAALLFTHDAHALVAPLQRVTISGTVEAPDGSPAAAHVVVGCQSVIAFAAFEALVVTQAGADGRFSLELPDEWVERGSVYRELDVFAHLAGYGIAMQHWSVADLPVGFEPRLVLPLAEEGRVRFVDPDGLPVTGARVWPQGLTDAERSEFRMPNAWWREHAATTDADGWATLPVSLDALQRIGFAADGFGVQNFGRDWQSLGPLPGEIEVIRPVARELRFEGGAPVGAAVQTGGYRVHELDGGEKYVAQFEQRTTIEGAASHVVLAPEEAYSVTVTTDDAEGLVFGRAEGADESSGSLALTLGRPATYRVHGRTVSAADGSPVAGVRLRMKAFHGGWVESGEDGRFASDCGGPGFGLDSLLAPDGFASQPFPDGPRGMRPEDGGDVDLGDLPLEPTWTASGVVVDAEGRPVPGAWVVGEQRVTSGRFTQNVTLSALTDDDGRYSMTGARAGIGLTVTARLGDRDAKLVQSAAEPSELVLTRALRAHGVLLDTVGSPASGASVELWRASPARVRGGEEVVSVGGAESVATNADGTFETPGGIEPETSYCLVWRGETLQPGRSDWFTGEELAAGVRLTVQRLAEVRGVLRRTDGSPLAGVEVRSRRGGVTVTTGPGGEFTLPGVAPEGDALVAVDAQGDAHVRWVEPGDGDVAWEVAHHSVERPLLPADAHDRGRELDGALELLEAHFQAAVDSGDEGRVLRAVRSLAWADPALVLQRVEAGLFETPWMRDFSLAYVADALLVASPEESLAVSMRLDRGMSRALSTLDAAERLDPVAEREQLALVRAEARAVDPPEHRVVVLARLADRLLDLGEVEVARDVLAEGGEVARALPTEDWAGYARSRFGEVLSRVDAQAGRELIDQLSSASDRPRHLLNTAQEIAASDPERAQALLEETADQRGSWPPERYVSRIAYRMAPVDLPRARGLAERFDATGFADGMIALALADANPAEARASLATAFERAERLAAKSSDRRRWFERPVAAAAALLPVAERVDPGGLRGYVARAVAVRRPPARGHFGGDDVVWRADASLAFYLARWRPELARGLLEPAVEAARRLRDSDRGSEYDAIWAAAAVVDPEWAVELGRELGGRAAAKIGLVLALPPVHRTTYVQEEIVDLWVVGKEDL